MKRCAKCKKQKPLDRFPIQRGASHNRHYYCSDCRNRYFKARYNSMSKKKKAVRLAQMRRYNAANKT